MFQSPIIGRRQFCKALTATAISAELPAWGQPTAEANGTAYQLVAQTDHARIIKAAAAYMALQPATVTSFSSGRSPGGPHDYFSQADYFWPDPKNPDGPYVNRDGQSNPANFNDHRRAMIALSIQMPALTAAWLLTKDR